MRIAAALSVGAALLSGCGPGAPAAGGPSPSRLAAAPCNEPASMNFPSPAEALVSAEPGLSPKARRNRTDGCAGVKFHIDEDGTVRDASLVVEEPQGYGFGQGALAALAETRYDPKKSNRGWYYLNTVYVLSTSSQTAGPRPAY